MHRIGRQLGEALSVHRGLDGSEADAEARRLLDRVGIADARRRLDDYPHELSGGMNQRVMIAMALAGEPDLLVADEPTTALDATIQAQILELLGEIRRDSGMAVVLISHDLGLIAENADRACVMYAGRIVEDAPTATVFGAAAHPYTQGLLAALPELEGPRRRLVPIAGTVPEPRNLPSGCACAELRGRAIGTRSPSVDELAPGHAGLHSRGGAPGMTPALLDVSGLARAYQVRRGPWPFGRSATLHAVDGVSFTLAAGRTLGLVGESGCGKTTTAKLVLGLVPATAGEIRVAGEVRPLPAPAAARAAKAHAVDLSGSAGALVAACRRRRIMEPLAIHEAGTAAERRERALGDGRRRLAPHY